MKRGGFSAFVQLENRSLVFDAGGEASVILETSIASASTELSYMPW